LTCVYAWTQTDGVALIRSPSKQKVSLVAHRLPALARRVASNSVRGRQERIDFNDSTGEVCDAGCRRTARLDRARTAAIAAGLGYRI
jgi:hypothetical protein